MTIVISDLRYNDSPIIFQKIGMVMPWTKTNYPNALKNLPQAVRNKAVEIANALFGKANMEEGGSIATTISPVKRWANYQKRVQKK